MSVPAESRPSGVIPTFPFQETPAPGGGGAVSPVVAGGGGKGPPDFDALRAALDAAVRALRSFQEYVGVLEQQQGLRGASAPAVSRPAVVLMDKLVGGPPLAPREVFPMGQLEAGATSRAVLSEGQQAQLDAALAQAFATDPAPPPRVTAAMVAAQAPGVPPPLVVAAPFIAAAPTIQSVAMPASAALMAAAPPLPGAFTAELPPALVPPPSVVPAAPPVPSAEPVALPFSPFQGLPPAPPSPSAGPTAQASSPETTWPTSPFFGAAQATTAPFRVVEPPPVMTATPDEAGARASLPPVSPAVASTPPVSATFPPVPEQGQVFNFAELLRANGQR